LVNKAILVPAAFAISALAPWAVTPLLMLGGAYLCFEGVEKVAHKMLHSKAEDDTNHARLASALVDPAADLLAIERDKVKGAVRTDFILSAEIIVIALGTVAAAPFGTRVAVLVGIALAMTVGVYGLVAGIVKLDDAGLWLSRREGAARTLGRAILLAAPWLMKALSAAGLVAMFLVGGGILVHGVPPLQHWVEATAGGLGGLAGGALPFVVDAVAGLAAGAVVLAVVVAVQKVRGK
jgi:predicted DNA repair protein MutK